MTVIEIVLTLLGLGNVGLIASVHYRLGCIGARIGEHHRRLTNLEARNVLG